MATKRKKVCEEDQEQEMENKRAKVELDRLDNLPESLQLHILSFLNTKHAVQTSVLSRSWRSLWTSTPVLHFDNFLFRRLSAFDKFVNEVLSYRDRSAKLNRLTFNRRGDICSTEMFNKVVDYAFSHGVNQLEVNICSSENCTWPIGSSDSLTSLKLRSWSLVSCSFLSGSFKNLTVLDLTRAIIPPFEPFSGVPMLEKLTLHECHLPADGQTLNVHAPRLSDLTISGCWFDRCELTTPNLRFFEYEGFDFPLFQTHDGLPVLDTVLIDFSGFCFHRHDEKRMFDGLVSLFQAFHNAKSLTLSSAIVDILSLFPEKLVNLDSPFCNLKCLNLDLRYDCKNQFARPRRCSYEIPSDVKAYLIHNSPEAKIYHHIFLSAKY